MMNRKVWTTIIGTALVVGIATAVLVPMLGAENRAQAQATSKSGTRRVQGEPVRVEFVKPEHRALEQVLNLPASLEPGEVAKLFAKTSGYVLKLNVDIGSRVEKDDVLLEIDVPEMMDELKQAEAVRAAKKAKVLALRAKATQAESMIVTARAETRRREAELSLGRITADRKRQLFDEKAIPEQDLDEAVSRLAVMEAEVQIANASVRAAEAEKAAVEADIAVAESQVAIEEARLGRLRTLMSYTTIRAPFQGVITERHVDPGAFVRSAAEGATTPLLTIARVDYVRLVMNVPESDASHVGVGTQIEAQCRQLGPAPLEATITRAAMALRENTRTMRVEADIDNSDGRLMPGLYARASVLLRSESRAMMIPSKAVRVRGTDISVLVAEGAVARAKSITLGYDDGIWAEVKNGLSGDERIIVSTAGVVAPGAPVAAVQAGL
ncbi:MAG: efflux RND transporter periplasmic adaptor subunit [Phycisphaerae bacterium]